MRIALVSTCQKSGCPPIGLVHLASHIHKNTEHRVDIIDANYQDIFRFDYYPYDIIGISAMTPTFEKANELAASIKDTWPDKPLVIGGVHISTDRDSQSCNIFDSIVIGEGEKSLLDLLEDYETQGYLKDRYENAFVNNLDDLPLPDWELIDRRYFTRQFNTTFAEWGIEGWLLTGRGCPYHCRFCSTTKFWEKVRFHSDEYVIKLLENLQNKQVTHIQVWDDLFTIDKNRLKRLMPYFSKTGIKFNCQPRINTIDRETCQILKSGNISLCIFGFESGNTARLQYLKNDKSLTMERGKKAITLCGRYGLEVQGSVMFGSPDETLKEMVDTLKFMLWGLFNGVQRLWAFVATPFPSTEFWQYLPRDFSYEDLSHYTERPLLLDKSIKLWQFKVIMCLAYRIENLYQLKKLWKLIRSVF